MTTRKTAPSGKRPSRGAIVYARHMPPPHILVQFPRATATVGGHECFTRDECERFKALLFGLEPPPPSEIMRLVHATDFAAELGMHRRTLIRYRHLADKLRAEASPPAADADAAKPEAAPVSRARQLEKVEG